jgi:capsular polysaccharide biosynthesis protein
VRSSSWPLLGAVAGLAVALAVTLVQDGTYRADASLVLVREGRPPGDDPQLAQAAEGAAELFEGRAVAASALRNLNLDESPGAFAERVDAETEAGSSLVRLSVEAPSEEEARRAAQEVAEVATVLFNDRFGPRTVASVWETAEADPDRVSPQPARNLALGALLGALSGWALLLAARRRPGAPRPKPAAPAPPAAPVPSGHVPGTGPETRPDRPQPPTEPPQPAAPQPFAMPNFGEWTIGDVERLVAEQGDAFPERQEEIQLYLETLRSVAGPDGRLPGDVDLVIEDVYADLIARSGSARRA